MAKLNMFILLLMLTTITLMTTGCDKSFKEHNYIEKILIKKFILKLINIPQSQQAYLFQRKFDHSEKMLVPQKSLFQQPY